ncbi:MAG: LysM domain-containing protein [Deferrisomatales bacterium]|nr:LysM domain-containing protein [Deferrisomatales bacterium]
MRRASAVLVGVVALWTAIPAPAGQEADHRVVRGDTLWDLSGHYWEDPWTWPELWALNPHFRNPHIIFPGDPIFLGRGGVEAGVPAEDRLVYLPWQRLEPGAPAAEARGRPTGEDGDGSGDGFAVSVARGRGLDFISPRPLERLGTVDNHYQIKVAYATGEDVELALAPGVSLQPGERLTLVDDSERVLHPVTGRPDGYFVRVLGQLEVVSVEEGRAIGWLWEAYDAVEDGDGVVAYRGPVGELRPHAARPGLEGLILRGAPGQINFASDDVVFLDRGASHGLEPGATLEIPVRKGRREAQGLVDLRTPLARLLVVAVEDATATSLILDSRAALEAGDRFVAATPAAVAGR